MNPSELQALLSEFTHQTSVTFWLGIVLAVISAGAGAFFGAYLQKRGEDQAIRENFAAIRDQLKTTTRDTEEIKQQLNNHLWRSQQLWSERMRYYSDLLSHLHQFRMVLDDLSDYFLEPGGEFLPDETRGDHFKRLQIDASSSCKEVEKLLGSAALFLSPQALSSLKKLIADHWGLVNIEAINTAEYVDGAHKLSAIAYDQVLNEAKAQLGIQSDT
jgi:uncharacterized membrane-anchored protein YhcB (DUF1043 family)